MPQYLGSGHETFDQPRGARQLGLKASRFGRPCREVPKGGGELDRVETYRGTTVQMGLSDKVRFEIAVSDQYVEPTVSALRNGAGTGEVGDGKIFVLPLEQAVRIRTEIGRAHV